MLLNLFIFLLFAPFAIAIEVPPYCEAAINAVYTFINAVYSYFEDTWVYLIKPRFDKSVATAASMTSFVEAEISVCSCKHTYIPYILIFAAFVFIAYLMLSRKTIQVEYINDCPCAIGLRELAEDITKTQELLSEDVKEIRSRRQNIRIVDVLPIKHSSDDDTL
ncbi:hypothetical protein BX667DRAFT_422697 [Coemansia mojavensis]|nr:hypothetical protein BX667DRAFT_422697 [Coemansia mojavensis]